MSDYFSVFGLPRELQLDGAALQRRFYELSRRHHPDFHQMAGEHARAASLERSALVNRAYRVLRDPLARVAHVITLEAGGDVEGGNAVKPTAPPLLLAEMLEVQEALEEAKAGGLDAAATERLVQQRQELTERRTAGDAALVERFGDWDRAIDAGADRSALVAWFRQALAAHAFLSTVIDDLDDALGRAQERDVSHRRH